MKFERTKTESRFLRMLAEANTHNERIFTDALLTNMEGQRLAAQMVQSRLRFVGWSPRSVGSASPAGYALASATVALQHPDTKKPPMSFFVVVPSEDPIHPLGIYGAINPGDSVVIVEGAMHSFEAIQNAIAAIEERNAKVVGVLALVWCLPGPVSDTLTIAGSKQEDRPIIVPFTTIFTTADVRAEDKIPLAATG